MATEETQGSSVSPANDNLRRKRLLMATSALVAVGILGISGTARADNPWVLDTMRGSFSTDTGIADHTVIDQHSDRAIGEGNLDIGSGQSVTINQNSSASLFVARDNRDNIQTSIDGALRANGRVMVLDRNGVFFGRESVLDVGGIVASTGAVDDDEIMSGANKIGISDIGKDVSIALEGTVNVSESGLAAFVAPNVRNSGVINARLGKVALASGEKATIDLYGDGLVEIVAPGKAGKSLVENGGAIRAESGEILVTAQGAKNLVDNVINTSGIADVSSVSVQGGKIVLSGGKVSVSGTLDASGKGGAGTIKALGASVEVSGAIRADGIGEGKGGTVYLYGIDSASLSGTVSAKGGIAGGDGGFVELSSPASVSYTGLVNTTAPAGATGTFLIDPADLYLWNGVGDPTLGAIFPFINAQYLANTLLWTNISLLADNSINVVEDIDLSTWDLFGLWQGITSNTLTFQAPTTNINGDVILGTGLLNVFSDTLNLNGKLFRRESVGGPLSYATDAQLDSSASLINIYGNDALIQQGVSFGEAGATIAVLPDFYTQSVFAYKDAMNFVAAPGALLLVGPGLNGFTITGDHVGVSGFSITGGTYGIRADKAHHLVLSGNYVTNSTLDGILVGRSFGSRIENNIVENTGRNGIEVREGAFGTVTGNTVRNVARNGITFSGMESVFVSANIIAGTGRNGIDGRMSSGIAIDGNIVELARGNGVAVSQSLDAEILGNYIGAFSAPVSIARHGIRVENVEFSRIAGNSIANAGQDGINGRDLYSVTVEGNAIGNVGDDGISLLDTGMAFVSNNIVGGAGDNGIQVRENILGLSVLFNEIYDIGDDGIDVGDTPWASVVGNRIRNVGALPGVTGGDGVRGFRIGEGYFTDNVIDGAQDDGIDIVDAEYSLVARNRVDNAGAVGIFGGGSEGFGADGISVRVDRRVGFGRTEIFDNEVFDSQDDGIDVAGLNYVLVDDNTVGNSGDDGVVVMAGHYYEPPSCEGYYCEYEGGDDVASFFAPLSGPFGSVVIVTNNEVSDSGTDGIQVEGYKAITIGDNEVSNSGVNGTYVSGPDNGFVAYYGNTLNDNPVGGHFESGTIDLTGDTNFVNGGNVGYLFRPYSFKGFSFAPTSLVDDTIGTTEFTGQSTFYVELDNGAFFDPGTPTILDGRDATYDGLNPAATGGILTQSEYDGLENMIFHFVDRNDLGLFDFGFVSPQSQTIENQEDIYNVFTPFSPGGGAFRVTILGLPTVPGGIGTGIAQNFAAISPASGEGENDQNPQDIEPAAGPGTGAARAGGGGTRIVGGRTQTASATGTPQDANCWGDAVNAAQAGQGANYDFGSSPEDLLGDATACQSGGPL